MEKTWRWFGKNDKITLSMLRQVGVEGIVTALHDVPNGDFTEASHLGGRADLIELARIFENTNPKLPMRVDHGPNMLGDENRGYNAGYTFLDRMFAMGQVQGILATVDRELGINRN